MPGHCGWNCVPFMPCGGKRQKSRKEDHLMEEKERERPENQVRAVLGQQGEVCREWGTWVLSAGG